MKRATNATNARMWAAVVIAVANVLPLALIAKQAFTPEAESLAWPTTWWPETWTLEHFRAAGEVVDLAGGLRMSLSVALMTVLATIALTLPAAWLSARSGRADRLLDVGVMVARSLPAMALAVPLGALFVRAGLYNHPSGVGLWLAHVLIGIPFAFFVLREAFHSLPRDVEEAAMVDGASPMRVFWSISLPLVRPAIAAAALLVFVISWDEFAFALLLQVTNRPLPALVYYFSAFGHPGLASAVATVMMVPAVVLVMLLLPALRSGTLSGSGR
ncbi:MAG: carbohydrate ABC transporter permease [Candidatus Binatia bacterium]